LVAQLFIVFMLKLASAPRNEVSPHDMKGKSAAVTRKIALPRTLILAGPQGSGKGTQAANLARMGYDHFEMGGVLREVAKQDTEIGKQVREAQEKGTFVDFIVVMQIVAEYMRSRRDMDMVMLDGIPRNEEQETAVTHQLDQLDRAGDARMLLIDISREEAVQNIMYRGIVTGRKDDQDRDVVNTRLEGFYNKTMRVVDMYDTRGQLLRLDGRPTADMQRAIQVEQRIRQLQGMEQLNGHGAELEKLLEERGEINTQLDDSRFVVFERLMRLMATAA
jgi:adenylate kinase